MSDIPFCSNRNLKVLCACVCLLLPVCALASPAVACVVEYNGQQTVVPLRAEADALGGVWHEAGVFSLRAALVVPHGVKPWLLVEVHAKAADGDDRIISSQKTKPPFDTGRMEVVEPRLGRMLGYTCGAAR